MSAYHRCSACGHVDPPANRCRACGHPTNNPELCALCTADLARTIGVSAIGAVLAELFDGFRAAVDAYHPYHGACEWCGNEPAFHRAALPNPAILCEDCYAAETCRTCAAPLTDGDGYDGECGSCAERR